MVCGQKLLSLLSAFQHYFRSQFMSYIIHMYFFMSDRPELAYLAGNMVSILSVIYLQAQMHISKSPLFICIEACLTHWSIQFALISCIPNVTMMTTQGSLQSIIQYVKHNLWHCQMLGSLICVRLITLQGIHTLIILEYFNILRIQFALTPLAKLV